MFGSGSGYVGKGVHFVDGGADDVGLHVGLGVGAKVLLDQHSPKGMFSQITQPPESL